MKLTITQRVILLSLCTSLVPLSLLCCLSIWGNKQVIETIATEDLQRQCVMLRREVDAFLNENIREVKNISQANLLEEGGANAITNFFEEIQTRNPHFSALGLANFNGDLTVSLNLGQDTKFTTVIPDGERLLKATNETSQGQVLVSKAFSWNGTEAICLMTPLTGHTDTDRSVLVAIIDLQPVQYRMEVFDQGIATDYQLYIANTQGMVIVSNNQKIEPFTKFSGLESNPDLFKIFQDKPGYLNFREVSGNEVMAGHVPLSPFGINQALDWNIVAVVQADQSYAQSLHFNQLLLLFSFVAAIITIVFGIKISKTLTQPLHQLNHFAGELSAGNYHVNIDSDRTDEFGTFANSMNHMRNEVLSSMAKIDEKNYFLKEELPDRKILQERYQIAKEDAEIANHSKSDFLANMSHELRSPMTAILGFADILLKEEMDTEQQRQYLSIILNNGNHLLNLVNDILDISKVESGKLELEYIDVDIREMLVDIEALLMVKTNEKELDFCVEATSSIPKTIQTDPTRVKQAIVNLIGNAIKFTEEGEIRVVVSCDPLNQLMTFEIIDTGIGITPKQQNSIFQPFSQADTSTTRQYGGTGLGLSITQQLSELLGGSLTVKSKPGEGSCFSLIISTGPLNETDLTEMNLKNKPNKIVEPINSSKKVLEGLNLLLVEDGPDNQRLIRFLLEKAGAQVTLASDGAEGLREAQRAWQKDDPFDVVLMDMQMPVMDGYEATRELRTLGYPLPILALTAHAMKGELERCLEAGCDSYLSKPINRELLINEIVQYAKRSLQQIASSEGTECSESL